MNHITRNPRLHTIGRQVYADVIRGVPGRGLEPDFIIECIIAVDQHRLARLDNRQHAIDDMFRLFVARQPLPEFQFSFR